MMRATKDLKTYFVIHHCVCMTCQVTSLSWRVTSILDRSLDIFRKINLEDSVSPVNSFTSHILHDIYMNN